MLAVAPSHAVRLSAHAARRLFAAVLVAAALAGLVLALSGAQRVRSGAVSLDSAGPAHLESAQPAAAPAPVATAVHVVQPGDTLWTIARRLQPTGDVRPLVARLRAALGPGPLQPGQRVPMPA